jgi:septal ring factor EnvC (AmiA/AmiB activator)
MESLNGKILKAEEKARRLKNRYDEALKELKDLQDKRREMQVAKLLEAIDKSGKTMEEVMRLIKL